MASTKLFTQEQMDELAATLRQDILAAAPRHIAQEAAANAGALTTRAYSRKDGWSFAFSVDLDALPDAHAQEYGSGIHATRGPQNRYLIMPKKAKVLSFYWENADVYALKAGLAIRYQLAKSAGITRNSWRYDGKVYAVWSGRHVLMNYVEHPGIRPYMGVGFIKPTLQAVSQYHSQGILAQAREGLGRLVREALSFKKEGKVSRLK